VQAVRYGSTNKQTNCCPANNIFKVSADQSYFILLSNFISFVGEPVLQTIAATPTKASLSQKGKKQ
jgi:hypothetical protein